MMAARAFSPHTLTGVCEVCVRVCMVCARVCRGVRVCAHSLCTTPAPALPVTLWVLTAVGASVVAFSSEGQFCSVSNPRGQFSLLSRLRGSSV